MRDAFFDFNFKTSYDRITLVGTGGENGNSLLWL